MTTQKRNMLVTMALPYANGPIHLGHLVGYIQADIWTRFQKMRGHECYYICGSDAHGTPIMIKAESMGISPEELVTKMRDDHQSDFQDFDINFDNFYTTHSDENRQFAETIYNRLNEAGDITKRTISQAFDPEKQLFLPDRYVKGDCPRCGADDQYGDSCESCGATYTPTELKNPKSALSGATPIEKESEHYFFQLGNYTQVLEAWTHDNHLQPEVTHKLEEWFEAGLKDWDISRDAPYFGFEIPHAPGKYFYVWLDAPMGYMASFKQFCDKHNVDFDAYWNADSKHELYHFVGKDIIYFHALFWPAVLSGANFRTPTAIFANGFLTVNGQKMSKSRGTFIKARTYLDHLSPDYLRYYFAAKLTDRVEDLDLNLEDFTLRINSDLVGKVVNIASRCAKFINKRFDNLLSEQLDNPALYESFVKAGDLIAESFEERNFNRAARQIIELAGLANQYIDEKKPWVLAKQEGEDANVQAICTQGLNLFKLIVTYLKPILPRLASDVESFLKIPPITWDNRSPALLNHTVDTFKPLLQRIDPQQLDAMKLAAAETT